MDLLDYSREIKNTADKFLEVSNLVALLSKYGEVIFTGSYAADIMINRDIDIYVVKDTDFTHEEYLEIFKDVFLAKISPGIHSGNEVDFKNPVHTFPFGFYLGLKFRINMMKWKVDLWFISRNEMRKIRFKDLSTMINNENRKLLLEIKKYTHDNDLPIPSYLIYEYVFEKGCKTLSEFKTLVNNQAIYTLGL